jgi:hypothetical protein
VFVFDDNEKPRIIAKQFYTTTEGGLRVNGQTIGVEKDDGFERDALVPLNVGFSEKFEFFADEFDAFSVGAVDDHHICFQFLFVVLVYFQQEFVDNGPFTGAGGAVENNMWNTIGLIERIQFFVYFLVKGENFHIREKRFIVLYLFRCLLFL